MIDRCQSTREGLRCSKRPHEIGRHVNAEGAAFWWDRTPTPAPARLTPPSPYTGESCVVCGSLEMRRHGGPCARCDVCGESGGCG